MVVIRIFLVLGAILVSFWGRSVVSVSFREDVFSVPLWQLLICAVFFVLAYRIFVRISNGIIGLFCFRPDLSKGIDSLQDAFSGMLVKDHKVVLNALKKAKKHLGEIPFISWLEGQLCLINGDNYKARSLFFSLSAKEKTTSLGAYSLAQMYLKDRQDDESAEAIKSVLAVYPNAQNFLHQIISLSIKSGKIEESFDYLKRLSSPNKKDIEAVLHYEKWKRDGSVDDLKKAHKLAPQIPNIAIDYSEELLKNNEPKSAGRVLVRSFEKFPYVDTFKKYVFKINAVEKTKRAKKLLRAAPQSWIPYYYLARISAEEGLIQSASEYIRKAYELKSYSFVFDEFLKINPSAEEIPHRCNIRFYWRCSECGNHESGWISVCPSCASVASYVFVEEPEEALPTVI